MPLPTECQKSTALGFVLVPLIAQVEVAQPKAGAEQILIRRRPN